MSDLIRLLPTQIVDGALRRGDGVAVGLVLGGAPSWELTDAATQAGLGATYRQILHALQHPISVYLVDAPIDYRAALARIDVQRQQAAPPMLAAVLQECSARISAEVPHLTHARQVLWAVPGAPAAHVRRGRAPGAAQADLTQAQAQARALLTALSSLGAALPPQLPSAETIARVLYAQLDPIRAIRYPLHGPLLPRVQSLFLGGDAHAEP